MEPLAREVRLRLHRAPLVPTLHRRRRLRGTLGHSRRRLRGTRWRLVGGAVRRHRTQQGAVWGDFTGKNPTDRAKNGTKRGFLVEGDGGPLSVIVAPANTHDSLLIQG